MKNRSLVFEIAVIVLFVRACGFNGLYAPLYLRASSPRRDVKKKFGKNSKKMPSLLVFSKFLRYNVL
jgi:hypothetical protein